MAAGRPYDVSTFLFYVEIWFDLQLAENILLYVQTSLSLTELRIQWNSEGKGTGAWR
jgi:hypothetical protein